MTGITPTNVDSLIHIDTISPGLRIPPNWGGCHILGHFWVNPHECTRFSSSRVYMVCWIIGIRVTPVAGFDTSAPHGNFKSPRLQFHRRSYGIPHFQTHFCASVVPARAGSLWRRLVSWRPCSIRCGSWTVVQRSRRRRSGDWFWLVVPLSYVCWFITAMKYGYIMIYL